MDIDPRVTRELLEMALREDIGSGDITSNSVVPTDAVANGTILSKSDGVVAGLDVARGIFTMVDPDVSFRESASDGEQVHQGQELASVRGLARPMLTAERTALNLLQRLSGIATMTSKYVRAASDYPARIVDTRKTTPGWRVLEKYAVRVGGGHNHRFGLYDAVLIKDNHIAAVGSIADAVARAREQIPHSMKIEVEVEDLDQVREAIGSDADIIMLDNMDVDMMSEAVRLIDGRSLVEASGGITLDHIPAVAATGVDLISIGALTNAAFPLDISMSVTLLRD